MNTQQSGKNDDTFHDFAVMLMFFLLSSMESDQFCQVDNGLLIGKKEEETWRKAGGRASGRLAIKFSLSLLPSASF